jgi:hypothetical protein
VTVFPIFFLPRNPERRTFIFLPFFYTRLKQSRKKKMPVAKISPSMLSSDFAYLAVEAKRMEKDGAEWLHLGKSL